MGVGILIEWGMPVLAWLYGLLVGSFLNVCSLRWPVDESVVRPRSKCPKCDAVIAWYDNIPVASWLVLRGRCRSCGVSVSMQYPLRQSSSEVQGAPNALRASPSEPSTSPVVPSVALSPPSVDPSAALLSRQSGPLHRSVLDSSVSPQAHNVSAKRRRQSRALRSSTLSCLSTLAAAWSWKVFWGDAAFLAGEPK